VSGAYKTLDYPGASVTAIDRINDSNELVGLEGPVGGPYHGWRKIGATFSTVDFPGATETRCRGVNNAGAIVGRYTDTSGVIHGMMVTP
jgi:hypothetical protein